MGRGAGEPWLSRSLVLVMRSLGAQVFFVYWYLAAMDRSRFSERPVSFSAQLGPSRLLTGTPA